MRPRKNIDIPEKEFTIKDVYKKCKEDGISITKVTVQNHLNRLLSSGYIKLIGVIQPRVGRPIKVFRKNEEEL